MGNSRKKGCRGGSKMVGKYKAESSEEETGKKYGKTDKKAEKYKKSEETQEKYSVRKYNQDYMDDYGDEAEEHGSRERIGISCDNCVEAYCGVCNDECDRKNGNHRECCKCIDKSFCTFCDLCKCSK